MKTERIKFRAWDGTRYVDPARVDIAGDGDIWVPEDDYGVSNDDLVIELWTGALDVNGKEIYHKDYVRDTATKHVGKVVLDERYLFPRWVVKNSWTEDMMIGKCEVIGNEYENPEIACQL